MGRATPLARLRARCRDERGFALVLVLWIAGLLAVLTAGLSVSVRTQVRVAHNVMDAARAEALADGGVTLAAMDLLAGRRDRAHARRFPLDGSAVACEIPGEGVLVIAVSDEAGRIDVNSAGIPLLQALVAGLGEQPETAARVAEAIFDFRDSDDDRKPNGAESADYRAAGLGWRPKNAPLQSVAELAQVRGLSPELLARMRPHLTAHSGLPGLDIGMARPELPALLRAGSEGAQAAFGSFPERHETAALPAMFVSASQQNAFAVRVVAQAVGRAVYVRKAILDLGPRQAPRQSLLRWGRDTDIQTTEENLLAEQKFSPC
jgi:general secretion pathway protein K